MEQLFTALSRAVEGSAVLALSAAFVWGVLSILLSPCPLASIPLSVGIIDQQGRLTTRRAFTISLLFSVGILIMMLMARHLNILVLGDVEAKAVGMPVAKYRLSLLAVAAMTTATGVCISGNIGFVGLVVPHMMRMLVGPDHRRLLPASVLAGGAFLVLCDTVGRVLVPPMEIRVGIMTALLGTPYFLYLLRKTHSLTR